MTVTEAQAPLLSGRPETTMSSTRVTPVPQQWPHISSTVTDINIVQLVVYCGPYQDSTIVFKNMSAKLEKISLFQI